MIMERLKHIGFVASCVLVTLLGSGFARLPDVTTSARPPISEVVRGQPEEHTYKTVGEFELVADVYRPSREGPFPVVVWLHGGALIFGNRGWVADDFVAFCEREGLVLVSLEYRLAPETKLPEILADVRDGLSWVREQGPELFGADPNRVAVAGNSAGGYLTLMAAATVRPALSAVVSYWGYGSVNGDWYTTPHYNDGDLAMLAPEDLRNDDGRLRRDLYYIYLRQQAKWTLEVTGLDPASQDSDFTPFNPLNQIDADFPPTLLIHGSEDQDVPVTESMAMAEELGRKGIPHELLTVPSAGHGLKGGDPALVAEAHRRAQRFLLHYLRMEN